MPPQMLPIQQPQQPQQPNMLRMGGGGMTPMPNVFEGGGGLMQMLQRGGGQNMMSRFGGGQGVMPMAYGNQNVMGGGGYGGGGAGGLPRGLLQMLMMRQQQGQGGGYDPNWNTQTMRSGSLMDINRRMQGGMDSANASVNGWLQGLLSGVQPG